MLPPNTPRVTKTTLSFLIAVALTCLHAVAAEDPAHPLAGTWVNVDENTDSITRMEVKEEADGWTIQAWGKCVPTDCDWGAVPLHMAVAYADAPHSRCEKIEVPGEKTVTRCIYDPLDIAKLQHGVAHWNHKDLVIQVFMTMQVANGELVVETVDVFDKTITGQTNMLIKDAFRKAERVPAEPVAESDGG